VRTLYLLPLVVWLAACAADLALIEGRQLMEQGKMEEAIRRLDRGVKADPGNEDLRLYYERSRDAYVRQLVYEADKARVMGRLDDAAAGYQHALQLKADDARAKKGLEATTLAQRQRAAIAEAQALFDAGKSDEALAKAKSVLAENPSHAEAQALERRIESQRVQAGTARAQLGAEFKAPVTLEFRDAPLKSVFEVLSRASGINFIFDRDVRPDLRATIYVRNTSIEDAVNFLLVTNQLEKRILNQNTVLVYPNLPNKARDYQELEVKSFYIGNADVKQTLNLIKTVVKTRDVFIDERLNLLVMRDTPEALRLAEKLIAAQDLADPEVILEVEVLEVARSKLQELGFRYPTQVSAGIEGLTEGPGRITLDEWLADRSSTVRINVTDPAFIINLRLQDGDTNLLANPRIRVRNREKAKVHIGDKLPVITTTSTANVGVSESVQYLDVGLKLDVEPNVYLENDVAMKVGLEVSNIVQEIRSQNGTLTYRLGTRNTATVLRVKSGETQILAGLIQDEDRRTVDKVPGLGNLPVIGRLFSSRNDTRAKTEIVLLITPYVVRNVDRPGPATLQFAAGTEANFGAAPLRLPLPGQQSGTQGGQTAALSPSPAGAAAAPPLEVRTLPADGAGTESTDVALVLAAPTQAQAGREFAVAISVPPGGPGTVRLDLLYDRTKLQAVGAPPDGNGRMTLTLSGTTTIRFRALEGQSGPAEISLANVSSGDGGPNLITPQPVTVNVTP
jgi:general secretion pathway protein D